MSDIQKAIDYCEYQLVHLKEDAVTLSGVFSGPIEKAIKMQETTLEALQEKAEREKGSTNFYLITKSPEVLANYIANLMESLSDPQQCVNTNYYAWLGWLNQVSK